MPRHFTRLSPIASALLAAGGIAVPHDAQERDAAAREMTAELPPPPPALPEENVRIEYARVLAAEPVIQTLRATAMVERCNPISPLSPAEGDSERRGLSRVVG